MLTTSEKREEVEKLIYDVVDDVNTRLTPEKQVAKSLDAPLFGDSATLDSVGLVNLIIGVEVTIEEETGFIITLTDERALTREETPFRTIGTLVDYICLLFEEAGNDSPSTADMTTAATNDGE